MTDANPLTPLVRQYFHKDEVVAAHALEAIGEQQAAGVLAALPVELAAPMFKHLQLTYAAAVLNDAAVELFVRVMTTLDKHRAAAVFMHLSDPARTRFVEHVPDDLKHAIQEFVTYPQDSVGRLMSTRFLSFRHDETAEEVIGKIRSMASYQYPASYAYVVDGQDKLVGVINMRDLMLAATDATLSTFMRTDLFKLHCFMGREEAAAELSKRKYFAVPVVDSEDHVLGIVKAEQLISVARAGVAESIQQMFGAGRDERAFSPMTFSLRKRLPWLHVNLVTAFMAAGVVALFEGLIAKMTVLAVFLPVVAGQGGNAGAQSLAIVMRGLVMREIPKERIARLVAKEGLIGTVNGAVTGVVTAIIAVLWYGNPYLGVVIGLGMLVNLCAAGLAGAAIPIVMKRLGLDPAQCSSIVLTTVTDIVGFFAFLGFALLFQARLMS